MFVSRNVLDFMEIVYKTSSAVWNLTTTHIVSQKTIKIDVKKCALELIYSAHWGPLGQTL